MNTYKDQMQASALQFISKANELGIVTSDISISQNLYGVSIYFDGIDSIGKTFKFRFSDHDCQRGRDVYTKLSPSSTDSFLFDYEKATFPDRFEWEYLDQYIKTPYGTKQVKRFLGRKTNVKL